jgi:hypothetical protein
MNATPHPKKSFNGEIGDYLGAMFKHCWWWLSTTLGGAGAYLSERWTGVIPSWAVTTIISSGFVIASFLSWRDERRRAEALSAPIDNTAEVTAVQIDLAALIEQGAHLRNRVQESPRGVQRLSLQKEVTVWAGEVEGYLRLHLTPLAVVQFTNPSCVLPEFTETDDLTRAVAARVAALNDIARAIPSYIKPRFL